MSWWRRAPLLGLVAAAGCGAARVDEGFAPAAPQQPGPPVREREAPYEIGRASYYSDRLAGRRTACGEPYDPRALTAAHRTLPFGTLVHVARSDGRYVVVRINDRGPFARGRVIDLSRRAAAELGMLREGVTDVVLRVVQAPRGP
jgi:rare lipoprotein A